MNDNNDKNDNTEWIDAATRPANGQFVCGFFEPTGKYSVGIYNNVYGTIDSYFGSCNWIQCVSHWVPLPAPLHR